MHVHDNEANHVISISSHVENFSWKYCQLMQYVSQLSNIFIYCISIYEYILMGLLKVLDYKWYTTIINRRQRESFKT